MTLTYYSRSLRPALWLSALLCALTLTSLPEAVRAQTFAQAHQTRTGHADARLTSLLEEDATSPALRRTIRLGFDGVPFEQALQTIAHRGDFGVSYNPNLIPQRQISMARAEGSVEEALHLLLARTDLDALISPQREIIIVPRTASAPPRETPQVGALPLYADLTLQKVEPRGTIRLQRQLQIITGQVTDAQEGTPLPGVNVVVQGTTVGTATDGNGEYELDVPENADVLVFSAVG